jgi:hypothetical protein
MSSSERRNASVYDGLLCLALLAIADRIVESSIPLMLVAIGVTAGTETNPDQIACAQGVPREEKLGWGHLVLDSPATSVPSTNSLAT